MAEQLSEYITLDDDYLENCMNKSSNDQFGEDLISYFLTQNNNPNAESFGLAAIEAKCDGLNDLTLDEILELLEFEQDYRDQMSVTELALFESLDRSKQLLYLQSAYNATVMSEDLYPPSATDPCSIYNGIGDAYRHALWNALCTVRLGETLTEQLTTAHEEKPFEYPLQSKEKQMDLYNNARGREIAFGAGLVWQLVKTALENGELRYLTQLNSSSNPLERCRATGSSLLTPTN